MEPFRLDPGRDPWERQPGESDPAWQAFLIYREMENRSIRRVARELSKSMVMISRWSAGHDWQVRTQAYDRDQDAIRLAAAAKAVRRAVQRHGEHLEAAAMALLQPLDAYLRKIAEMRREAPGGNPFHDWSLRELSREAHSAARLIPALVQAERLVHGLSTERGEYTVRDAERAEAERRVRDMGRGELDVYLTGVEDGRAVERGGRPALEAGPADVTVD